MHEEFLSSRLNTRKEEGLLRRLSPPNNLVDFSSNDYLGFARSKELEQLIAAEHGIGNTEHRTGSTGSRLLTGNSHYAESLEKFIAGYHNAEAGLLFNSGYTANTGLISCVAQKEDVILYDALSHASIYDGVRLSKATSYPFRHNDLLHLEERLKNFRNSCNEKSNGFVIVESLYSMDGDFAPLLEIVALCETYHVNLIVDEAHATGIFGAKGAGRVNELNLEKRIFARTHTFGKALGCHGAIVLGSEQLRQYLINFSRPFIYTTALPDHVLFAIKSAYGLLNKYYNSILYTSNLIKLFKEKIEYYVSLRFIESCSPIQSLVVEGNGAVKKIASLTQKDGYDVRPILSPTVPKGKERIRICLHAFNTEEEISGLLFSLQKNNKLVFEKQMVI